MSLTTRPTHSPSTLPSQRAANRALPSLITLLMLAAGAVTALAAGPLPATAAPGKAGTSAPPKAATNASINTGATARTDTRTKTATAPKGKPATPRQQLKSEAEGLALATATVETINEAQLNVAMRVLTGQADCEFNERVSVSPMDGQPGHFLVGHKGLRYTMVPEETATGAVRLVDRRAGVVWLQIPVKSMLMNSKQGRRMVDACTHAEQRAAVLAVAEAGAGLGIVPSAAAIPAQAPASASASPATTTPAAPTASAPTAPAASTTTAAVPAAVPGLPAATTTTTLAESPAAPASAPR